MHIFFINQILCLLGTTTTIKISWLFRTVTIQNFVSICEFLLFSFFGMDVPSDSTLWLYKNHSWWVFLPLFFMFGMEFVTFLEWKFLITLNLLLYFKSILADYNWERKDTYYSIALYEESGFHPNGHLFLCFIHNVFLLIFIRD